MWVPLRVQGVGGGCRQNPRDTGLAGKWRPRKRWKGAQRRSRKSGEDTGAKNLEEEAENKENIAKQPRMQRCHNPREIAGGLWWGQKPA